MTRQDDAMGNPVANRTTRLAWLRCTRRVAWMFVVVTAYSGAPAILAGQDSSGVRSGVRFSGTVVDSLRHAGSGLAGAEVLLQGPTESWLALTHASGSFDFRAVPRGEYRVGVFHPLLDSLGVALPGISVRLDADTSSIVIAIPSARTLARALCGKAGEAGAVVRVRTTGPRPSGAGTLEVEFQWAELALGGGRLPQRTPQRRVSQVDAHGRALLCDVPTETELNLRITDSRATDAGRTVLQTTVRLSSAVVQTVDVDLSRNRVSMAASSSVAVTLDPIRIVAERDKYLDRMGYTRRQQGRSGTFISQEEIERRNPHSVAEMFAHVNGFIVSDDVVRSARPGFSLSPVRQSSCGPLILIDGVPVNPDRGAADPQNASSNSVKLREIVAPAEVVAVEAYAGLSNIPFELSASGRTRCGLIAIWTKRGVR